MASKPLEPIRHPESFGHADYWYAQSPSSVYVFWAEDTTLFKVGRTGEHADTRLKSVQAMSPLMLRCLAEGYGGSTREAYLHKRLAPYRHHGEWFDLPEEIVFWLLGQFGDTTELRRDVEKARGTTDQAHA